MSQDFLSQEKVDALLKGVTAIADDDDSVDAHLDWAAEMSDQPLGSPASREVCLRAAEREVAYWTGVIHGLTGKVKHSRGLNELPRN